MIVMKNVSFCVHSQRIPRAILRNQSLIIGDRERVGIYAETGSGKTTLARLLAGLATPTAGRITHFGTVSWPIGIASLIHPELTVAENVTVISRLSSADPIGAQQAFWKLILQDLDAQKLAKTLTPMERALMGFSLSLMSPRQHYIFDEKLNVGTAAQKQRQNALLEVRLKNAGTILISRNPRLLRSNAFRFFSLADGRLTRMTPQKMSERAGTHV